MVATPGISIGYWKARNRPAGGALARVEPEDVLAVEQHLALGDLVVFLAGEHIAQRRLARAVAAHHGMHFARPERSRFTPLRISRSSIRACRLRISSMGVVTSVSAFCAGSPSQ